MKKVPYFDTLFSMFFTGTEARGTARASLMLLTAE